MILQGHTPPHLVCHPIKHTGQSLWRMQVALPKHGCNVLCCAVLSDLAAMQFTGQDTNVSADSMGDDLYTWNVELWRTAFKPDCQLAQVQAPHGSLAAAVPISSTACGGRARCGVAALGMLQGLRT